MLKYALTWLVFACLFTSCQPINGWIWQDDDWIEEEVVEEAILFKYRVRQDFTQYNIK